jgi:hypothetical protein
LDQWKLGILTVASGCPVVPESFWSLTLLVYSWVKVRYYGNVGTVRESANRAVGSQAMEERVLEQT